MPDWSSATWLRSSGDRAGVATVKAVVDVAWIKTASAGLILFAVLLVSQAAQIAAALG